ncbi:MAG: signal recognition particle receptor subunit alpha, partial [Candidatus Zixiibacteriota bacterium]
MLSAFDKLKQSLRKTREGLIGRISSVVSRRKIDEDLLDEIEEILIEADVGVAATMRLLECLRAKAKEQKLNDGDALIEVLQCEISRLLITTSDSD